MKSEFGCERKTNALEPISHHIILIL